MPTGDNFMFEQQRAVERMMEMNRRSKENQGAQAPTHNMPPAPAFVRLNDNPKYQDDGVTPREAPQSFLTATKKEPSKSGFSLPILDTLKIDRDTTLILGLLLILWSEKSDRYLLLALLYILL